VAGEGAVFVEPESVDSIRAGLEKILESEELRSTLACKGRKRAEEYRWENSADKTWAFWNSL